MEKLIAAIVLIAESLKRIADSLEAKTASAEPVAAPEEPKSRKSRKADPVPEEQLAEDDAPVDDVVGSEEEEPAVEEEATITVEELQALAKKAVAKGKVSEIKPWLAKRKAASVGTMDPKHYADAKAFLTKLAS